MIRGLSQSELATLLQLKGNGWVSRLEHGRIAVDGSVVEDLAKVFDCSVDHLTRPVDDPIVSRPWLRAYADATAKDLDAAVSENLLVYETAMVGGLKFLPDTLPLFHGDLNDDLAIESFAGEVRAAADISEEAVVSNMMRAAERLGCVIVPLTEDLGRHLGLSQRIDGRAFIRASRAGGVSAESPRVPGDRQRHTIAHELGHLAIHAAAPPPDDPESARRIENQAHRFAASFLAPAGPLLEDWQSLGSKVTLTALAQLKATWGVSIKSLITRFRHLGIIDDDRARSLYKQISARGWATQEPVPVTNEHAIWLRKAAESMSGADASTFLVTTAGLSSSYVAPWLDWEGRDRIADVVPLHRQPVDRRDLLGAH